MKRLLRFFLFLALLVPLSISCNRADIRPVTATLTMATGTIHLIRDGKRGSPTPGNSIHEGDILETGEQSMAIIEWGTSYVKLSEKARITWDQIRRNNDSNASITEIGLPAGRIFVKTSLKLFKGESLNVKSPTAVASVRGTEMRFIQYPSGSRVECIEGKVRVAHAETGRGAVFLGAGQAALVEPGKEIRIVPIQKISASPTGSPSFRSRSKISAENSGTPARKDPLKGERVLDGKEGSTAFISGSKDITDKNRDGKTTDISGESTLTDKPDVDMPSLR